MIHTGRDSTFVFWMVKAYPEIQMDIFMQTADIISCISTGGAMEHFTGDMPQVLICFFGGIIRMHLWKEAKMKAALAAERLLTMMEQHICPTGYLTPQRKMLIRGLGLQKLYFPMKTGNILNFPLVVWIIGEL